MRRLLAGVAVVGIAGCYPEEDRYDAGYDDGYAVGYNTSCEIRASFIHGEWDNASYSEGYAAGVTDGIISCLAERP